MAGKFSLGLSLLVFVIAAIDSKCPIDWAGLSGTCYWFSRTQMTYIDAVNDCKTKAGQLVVDDSEAKHNFLREFLSVFSSMKQKSYWSGADDFAKEGSWHWIGTGNAVGPYMNWGPGQPDGNTTANCMVLQWFNDTLAWADASCGTHSGHHNHLKGGHYYICEKSESSFTT